MKLVSNLGFFGILIFHLVANTTMVAYYGGGLLGFFQAQWMGIPFFVDHIFKFSVVLALLWAYKTYKNKLKV